jgi:uncharacterized protein (DUF2126 family)
VHGAGSEPKKETVWWNPFFGTVVRWGKSCVHFFQLPHFMLQGLVGVTNKILDPNCFFWRPSSYAVSGK